MIIYYNTFHYFLNFLFLIFIANRLVHIPRNNINLKMVFDKKVFLFNYIIDKYTSCTKVLFFKLFNNLSNNKKHDIVKQIFVQYLSNIEGVFIKLHHFYQT